VTVRFSEFIPLLHGLTLIPSGQSSLLAARSLPNFANTTAPANGTTKRSSIADTGLVRRSVHGKSHHDLAIRAAAAAAAKALEARADPTTTCPPFWLPKPQPSAFPIDPAGKGPAVADIVGSAEVQQAFQSAWDDSFDTTATAKEVVSNFSAMHYIDDVL